jgi:hypothetical protein
MVYYIGNQPILIGGAIILAVWYLVIPSALSRVLFEAGCGIFIL